MMIIAVIGQKGGTAKTTTTTGLAVAAALKGHAVAILDLDPQTNAASWMRRRAAKHPDAVQVAARSIQPGELANYVESLKAAKAEFVFIDTPGRLDAGALAAARVADLVLIPTRKQTFDLETLEATADLVTQAKNPPAYLVAVGQHPSAKDPVGAMRPFAERFGLEVAPVALAHRTIYADAPGFGLGPQEIEPDGKAAGELNALFDFVSQLNGSTAQPLKRKATK